jgi:anthranilate synthase
MSQTVFTTAAGLRISADATEALLNEALNPVFNGIDVKKGAVFSSGFDYPGRHSRWDIGFINPALEIIVRGKGFKINSLDPSGRGLIEAIHPALASNKHLTSVSLDGDKLSGEIVEPPRYFTEEDRSRQPSIFSMLRTIVEQFRIPTEQFAGSGRDALLAGHFGLYGAFGYDLIFQFEAIKFNHPRSGDEKDCHLYLPLELFVVDRMKESAFRIRYSIADKAGKAIAEPAENNSSLGKVFPLPEPSGSAEIVCDHKAGEFADKVRGVIEGTRQGDYFEVVLSQSFSTRFSDKPTALFERMSRINPSPYMFLINFGGEHLVGTSPELFARVSGRRYETCPIAGTVSRGATALEDADKARELLDSQKDESELTMCTDVDRNDMARVCEPGSVRVIGRRQLEFYSHLIHTVDHVEGTIAERYDALDAFQTHMWACTVTGAPKPAAVREIEKLENSPRGWYSGAIGILGFDGGLNTGITLRTAHLKNGRASVRAGATLHYESDPIAEEQETRTKAGAFLSAISSSGAPSHSTERDGSGLAELSVVRSGWNGAKSGRARPKVLIVDCQDSFVHNLAAYLRALDTDVVTLRSGFPLEMLDEHKPDLVLLSPGPGTPTEFGVPSLVGTLVERQLPGIGVCLGHQGIGQYFGATLGVLPRPAHGKVSTIVHSGSPLFAGVPSPFEAGRYHSLYLIENTVPDCLEIIARSTDSEGGMTGVPMAVAHKTLPIAGVQFHPESMMTLKRNAGYKLLRNMITVLTK